MIPAPKNHSALPWILLLAILAVCLVCLVCAMGGTGVYLLSRSANASRAAGSPVSPSSDPDAGRRAGNANAKVVVEEFADFQCPYCGQFHAKGEPRLRTEYIQRGKVLFIFRNYPVLDGGDTSGESHLAALGALCAGEQGKFWEYHDTLFENQAGENSGGFAAPHLLSFAKTLGLNGSRFDQCVQTKRYESVLDGDIRLGENRNLQGVPTFFINGTMMLGFDDAAFFSAIDNALNQ